MVGVFFNNASDAPRRRKLFRLIAQMKDDGRSRYISLRFLNVELVLARGAVGVGVVPGLDKEGDLRVVSRISQVYA